MKALVIGATGATGKDIVEVLLEDPVYTQVAVFVRRVTGVIHPKLTEIVTDFDKLDDVAAHINGDVLFSCLGTTLKTAGSKENQWHIDYEIPLRFARIARKNSVHTIVLLSAYGATTSSRVFYSKMKGQLEEDTLKLGFDRCVVFRPGLLLRKNSDRFGERVGGAILRLANAVGLARKFRPLPTLTLAEKMVKAPKSLAQGKHFIQLDDIFKF